MGDHEEILPGNRKRYQLKLVDPYNPEENTIEIGWAEAEQMVNGGLILQAFVTGNYWVQTNNAPDQLHIKGTLPASLRKD
jgi:hypothetical protein